MKRTHVVVFATLAAACYRTVAIKPTELERLVRARPTETLAVETVDGDTVDVAGDAPVRLRTWHGRTFLLDRRKPVASDDLSAVTVQTIDHWKTDILVVTVLAGIVASLLLTPKSAPEECKWFCP